MMQYTIKYKESREEKEDTIMDLKTIYVMNYDVLRGIRGNFYYELYENIPLCFKQKKYESIDVESIPKEKEIIILRKNGSLIVMSVFKVAYYEWKIFVVVNIIKGGLQLIENESREEMPKLADKIILSNEYNNVDVLVLRKKG